MAWWCHTVGACLRLPGRSLLGPLHWHLHSLSAMGHGEPTWTLPARHTDKAWKLLTLLVEGQALALPACSLISLELANKAIISRPS